MSFWPFVRTPFTDLTANVVNHQNYHKGTCSDMEMKVMDCLEAYGVDRGQIKCDPLIKDFQECVGMKKQLKRFYAMRMERQRQYWAGERTKDNLYAPPPQHDSF